jgi:hypothetical protein
MLNTSFIQSNIPNLETQEQLLKNRFELEKANGYNFEITHIKTEPNTVKLANKYELEDREYSKEELDYLVYTLTHGLIDGIIREATKRNAKTITLMYGLESIMVPWGMKIVDSRGHVLFYPPHKSFNYFTEKDEISIPCLVGVILVDFDK